MVSSILRPNSEINEGDTVRHEIYVTDGDVPVVDPARILYTLYSPSGAVLTTRDSDIAGEVASLGQGKFEARYTVGGEGMYTVVVRVWTLDGDVRGREWRLPVSPLTGMDLPT